MPVILGGVSNDTWLKEHRGGRDRPRTAEVVKRSDDGRARLRLAKAWDDLEIDEQLILESGVEGFAVNIYALHPQHNFVDVRRFWPLTEMTRVTVRRRAA